MENSSIKRVNRRYLTDDLWYEIFLRLTLDAIFKCKSVSKLWFSVLSNPSFLKKWYKLNISSLPWGFVYKYPFPEDRYTRILQVAFPVIHSRYVSHPGFSFRFLHQAVDDYISLLGSSNGLVLCTVSLDRQRGYYVCNPLTQKFVLLPPPPGNEYSDTVTGFVCNEECFSGSSSYKVVRIPRLGDPIYELRVEMFSSDMGEWNVYHVSCPPNTTWEFSSIANYVAHNGVLYWFQEKNNKIIAVSFDGNNTNRGTRRDECRLIDMPDLEVNGGDDVEYLSQFLGESEGFICLARFNTMEGSLSVWVLDGDDWDMLHKDIKLYDQLAEIESQLIDGSGGEDFTNDIKVVGFSPVDKNVVILSCKKYVWAYNTETRVFEQLCQPSFLRSNVNSSDQHSALEFVFKPRPTILPPVSWSEASILDASFRFDNGFLGLGGVISEETLKPWYIFGSQ